MKSKQVNISVPLVLYEETSEYIKEKGYKNVQDLVLELMRNKVIHERVTEYQNIEEKMRRGETLAFENQEEALKFLEDPMDYHKENEN